MKMNENPIVYDLDYLEKTFESHDKESVIQLEKFKKEHKKNWPDEEYESLEFSLPRALLTIVKEIKLIKGGKCLE